MNISFNKIRLYALAAGFLVLFFLIGLVKQVLFHA